MNEEMDSRRPDGGLNLDEFLNLESLPDMNEFWPEENYPNSGFPTNQQLSDSSAFSPQMGQTQAFGLQQTQQYGSDGGGLYAESDRTNLVYEPLSKAQPQFDPQIQPEAQQYQAFGEQQSYLMSPRENQRPSRAASGAPSRPSSRQDIPAIVLQTTVSEEPQSYIAANNQAMTLAQPGPADFAQQSQHLSQHSGSLVSFSDYSYGSVPSPLSTTGTPIGSPIPFPDDTGIMHFNESEPFGELGDFDFKPRETTPGFYQPDTLLSSSLQVQQSLKSNLPQHPSQMSPLNQLERVRSALDNMSEASQQQLRRVESYAGVSQSTHLLQDADRYLELPTFQLGSEASDSGPSGPPSPGTPLPSGRLRSSSNASSTSTGRPRSASSPSPLVTGVGVGVGRRRSQKGPSIYACELCDKRFTRTYNLRSHLRTHTDERPFLCAICGKAFSRQHDRRRHEELHSGEKRFQCGGLVFGTGAPLQADDDPSDSEAGPRWGCGRKFARSDALGRHLRTDNGRHCLEPISQAVLEHVGDRSQPVEGLVYMGDSDSQAPQFELVDGEGINASRRSVIASALADLLSEKK